MLTLFLETITPFLQENLAPSYSMIFQKSQPPINERGIHTRLVFDRCSFRTFMIEGEFEHITFLSLQK